jgi:hypothetical protein
MTRNKWLTLALALAIPVVAFASGTLELRADNAGATVLTVKYPTATYPLMQINTSGLIEWGSGSAITDTNLYRSTADTLKTDDNLIVGSDLSGDGGDQIVGFLNNHVTASTTALTAAQCGSTIINTGAVVQPLPEASTVLGCRYTFAAGTDDDYDIDPADATDVLGRASIDGAAIAGAAGDEYRLTDTGSSLTIQATAANLWTVVSHNGPITDVN